MYLLKNPKIYLIGALLHLLLFSDAGWKVLFLHLSSRLLPPSTTTSTSTASTSTIFTSKARLSTLAFLPSLSGSKMPLRERQKTKLGRIYIWCTSARCQSAKRMNFFPSRYRTTHGGRKIWFTRISFF